MRAADVVARQSDGPRGQGSWGWALLAIWLSTIWVSCWSPSAAAMRWARCWAAAAISLVPQHGVDGATDGGRGRCFGVEATSDAGPGDAGGDFGLVLVAAGRHDRHAVAQGVLHAAVAAVGHVDIGAWQEFVVGQELGGTRVGGQWRQGVERAAAGGDNDKDVVVGECLQCRGDDLAVVPVRDRALGDVHDGP